MDRSRSVGTGLDLREPVEVYVLGNSGSLLVLSALYSAVDGLLDT